MTNSYIPYVTRRLSVIFILLTGDIAFAGKAEEYVMGFNFLESLVSEIKSNFSNLIVKVVALPGNHDCNFSKESGARKLALKATDEFLKLLDNNELSIISSIMGVQDEFFDFLIRIENTFNNIKDNAIVSPLLENQNDLQSIKRIYYERIFTLGDFKVRFNCYNTAWISQINESQGKLFFPIKLIQLSNERCNLIISAFHHPTLWLESNNSREFRNLVEGSSDLIMTGHEHVAGHYSKRTIAGQINDYIEGALLQGKVTEPSGFNIVLLDLNIKNKRLIEYKTISDIYEIVKDSDWLPIERSKGLQASEFQPKESFNSFLQDPGAGFTHPEKLKIFLDDIFIYPELYRFNIEKKAQEAKQLVSTDKAQEFILANPFILFIGPDTIGRTALAKTIYKIFLRDQIIPLMINGRNIKKTDSEAVSKLITQTFEEQYEINSEYYLQLESKAKVLIIDDLHLSKLNPTGRDLFIAEAKNHFGRIIIFANELYRIEELAIDEERNKNILFTFQHTEINELNSELRYNLIERWFKLGQEYVSTDEELIHKISEAMKVVDTLLGKNFIPKYPFFVLSILQTLESQTRNSFTSAYASFYEVIIIQALQANTSSRITTDMIKAFLPFVANKLFEVRRRYLTELELEETIKVYCHEYALNFPHNEMPKILQTFNILVIQIDGTVSFTYKYIYYYFMAKYIANNINTIQNKRKMRALINRMISNLYIEDYANIILFLVYFTQDDLTIEKIISQAKTVYAEYEPCDLDKDILFVGKLRYEMPKIQLTDGDPESHRKEHLRKIDTIERNLGINEKKDDYFFEQEQEQELDDLLNINVALKTLQIMGQILRNFTGSLPRKLKHSLTIESYNLGLRTMKVFFKFFEDNLDLIRTHFAQWLRFTHENLNDEELIKRTDSSISIIITAIAYCLIKRISQDAGSQYLEQTYRQVLEENNDKIAITLIDLAIKLDHFRNFPKMDVLDIHSKYNKNLFAMTLLCEMVRERFYLYHSTYKLRQEICDKLEIDYSNKIKLIESKDKI